MTIRSEVEKKILQFANSRNMKVAFEGCAFDPPTQSPYLRVWFLDKAIFSRDVSLLTKTTAGMFQVDVLCLDKRGSAEVEEISSQVAALFPYAGTEFETIVIDNHPQIGRAMIEGNFRVVPVTVSYRQESEAG